MSEELKTMEEDVGYLDAQAGQGFENIGANEVSTPMLLITQAMSVAVQDGAVPVGHFMNSLTNRDYGTNINLIVCHFDKVWIEWKPNGGGFVARYPVNGIPVTGDAWSGMKNPATGNDVLETWMYLCIMPDYPEDGFIVFNSTRGNMKYLKAWNTALKTLRTPKGRPAPVFGAVWNLQLGQDQNKAGQRYYSCNVNGKSSIKFVAWVPEKVFREYVQPCREVAVSTLADNRVVAQIEDKSVEDTDAY